MNLTTEQKLKLQASVNAIVEAQKAFAEVASEMNADKNWRGFGDVVAASGELNKMCDEGHINYFLKVLNK